MRLAPAVDATRRDPPVRYRPVKRPTRTHQPPWERTDRQTCHARDQQGAASGTAAATPISRLAVDTMPSLAPNTAGAVPPDAVASVNLP
jgi:hypothetical protein